MKIATFSIPYIHGHTIIVFISSIIKDPGYHKTTIKSKFNNLVTKLKTLNNNKNKTQKNEQNFALKILQKLNNIV